MPPLPPAIAAELGKSLRDIGRSAGAVATGQQAEYIRGAEPESIWGKMQQATARQYCRRYADDPSNLSDLAKYISEQKCRPYLDDIGYGTGPTIGTPVKGGQCPEMYRFEGTVFWRVDGDFVGSPSMPSQAVATENIFQGPVSVIGPRYFDPGPFGPRGFIFQFQTATGVAEQIQILNPTFGQSAARLEGQFLRADGTPGPCGSPTPEVTDPIPPGTPGPKYEPYNPSPDVDIDIGIEINIDGSIDVDFGTGPITIDPFGEDEGGGGGDAPIDPTPTDPGSPGGTGTTGSGGEDEGEAPEGQELVGVLVEVLDAPELANTFGRTTQTVYRGIGYVRMGYPGRLGTDVSGGAVISPQFFHAQQRGLTSHKVSANLGFNLSVTPYYRDTNL